MARKADFSEDEWETLRKGAVGAGLLVSVSDRGFLDTFREAGALAQHLADARRDTASELVRELADERGTGFGLTASAEEVEAETLEALRRSVTMLGAKAPDEVEPYRAFVRALAESVARAAGGGEAAESAALERVRSTLELA